jgi:protoporphyrinogen oxidase
MDHFPVVIVGAGPAGLTAAYELVKRGVRPLVLEKSGHVGGIARTETYRGYRFDIGGHRFYTKVDAVNRLWKEILGEEFLTRPRLSRIYYGGKFYHYPLQLFNVIGNLGLIESLLILLSYFKARIRPVTEEENFEQWVSNRFGERLYRAFFKTYTEKVWGIPCHQIQAEWAAQRIKDLSFRTALLNALYPDKKNVEIKTLISAFQYPRSGPGMMWEKCRDMIEEKGGSVWLRAETTRVRREGRRITGLTVRTDGGDRPIPVDHLISTMPLKELCTRFDPPLPPETRAAAGGLNYRDFLVVGLILNRPDIFPDNWIYIHSPDVRVGRIQNFKNWSPDMVPDPSRTSLGMEYFCNENDTLWAMEDRLLIELAGRELADLGLADARDVEDGVVIRQSKAYPVYDAEYRRHLGVIRHSIDAFENLQSIGRNGMHRYNNQDHSMLAAMLAVRNLFGETHNLWEVNTERSYYEEFMTEESRKGAPD